jgi:hypothetical protein
LAKGGTIVRRWSALDVQTALLLVGGLACLLLPWSWSARGLAGAFVGGLPWSMPVFYGALGNAINGGNSSAADTVLGILLVEGVVLNVMLVLLSRWVRRSGLDTFVSAMSDDAPSIKRRCGARVIDLIAYLFLCQLVFQFCAAIGGRKGDELWLAPFRQVSLW